MRFLSLCLLVLWHVCAASAEFSVRLPTKNNYLLQGQNERFFMYVNRLKDGVDLKPWTGGTYGLVRTVVDTPQGPVCVKFHEGIDISPVQRDSNGVPQDVVHPVAPGTVVHICNASTHSNYGKYVVVRHDTKDGPLFSLYAHLSSITCSLNDRVGTGNSLGILGYTGVGTNKTRAHLHLELCLMINKDYTYWYDAHIKTPNHHGNYNGLNLIGFDPTPLLRSGQKGERTTLSKHFATLKPEFKTRIPGAKMPSIGKMYPFLVKTNNVPLNKARSWIISFTDTGVPIALEADHKVCSEPELVWLRPDAVLAQYRTCSRVKSLGGGKYILSPAGKRHAQSYAFDKSQLPPAPPADLPQAPSPAEAKTSA